MDELIEIFFDILEAIIGLTPVLIVLLLLVLLVVVLVAGI